MWHFAWFIFWDEDKDEQGLSGRRSGGWSVRRHILDGSMSIALRFFFVFVLRWPITTKCRKYLYASWANIPGRIGCSLPGPFLLCSVWHALPCHTNSLNTSVKLSPTIREIGNKFFSQLGEWKIDNDNKENNLLYIYRLFAHTHTHTHICVCEDLRDHPINQYQYVWYDAISKRTRERCYGSDLSRHLCVSQSCRDIRLKLFVRVCMVYPMLQQIGACRLHE